MSVFFSVGNLTSAAQSSDSSPSRQQVIPENLEEELPVSSAEEVEVPQLAEWRQYITQPFSKMKDKKLKAIGKELAGLPDTRSVRSFKKDYERTMQLKKELDGYWEVANRPYDFDDVEATKEKVFQLESRVNQEQAEDIHNGLLTVLVRFRKGAITLQQIVIGFEEIIATVPKDEKGKYIRTPDTKRNLVARFEEVLSEHSESVQKRIKGNPYLEGLYSGYVGGMRMNPFNTGLQGVRNQIMSQKTDIE